MFSFGSVQKEDIFEIDDIRQLVLTFPHKAVLEDPDSPGEAARSNGLVPLVSGKGFVQLPALIEAFRVLLDKSMTRPESRIRT
jgi:hypothetical protein